MIIVQSKRFFQFLTRPWVSGIALFPFIVVREKQYLQDPYCLNHEKIHIRQQAELLVIFFYLWYVTEYLIRWCMYKNAYLAYRSISFEKEAYLNENDLNYLKRRRFWSFLQYI